MGDLDDDTRLEVVGPTSFRAELSPDWEIWGPNGGYLAAVALRAAGVAMGRARPASITAHFVGAGASAAADIDVTINRATRVATSASVTISQRGRIVLVATVWGVDGDLAGLEHHGPSRPLAGVGDPEDLPSVAALMADSPGFVAHPFWKNIDNRPLDWVVDWDARAASEPVKRGWYRFIPTATFDDPWVDAMRSLILIDVDSWPAATMAHIGELEHYAPTIEVSARFVGLAGDDAWLFNTASAPAAAGGVIVASGEVWTHSGRLVALGGSTLLCRPATRRPDR